MRSSRVAVLTLLLLVALSAPACAQYMIVGNDQKISWDEAGKAVLGPPGHDSVSIVDISNRESPRIVVSLPLMNSIFGPPTNLAITPDEKLALVANSMDWQPDGAGWKAVPDDKVYVIDLAASPPAHVATVRHKTSVPVNFQMASSEVSTATRMHALVVQNAIFLTPPGLR